MKILPSLFAGATLVAAISGCASSKPVALAPVGPAPLVANTHVGSGWLKVYTATETHQIGDNTYYYPHTGYTIFNEAGQRVEYVDNHIGDMDETPRPVSLPEGNYKILAESESYGRVTVPITIVNGRNTEVHLDREWIPSPQTASNELVRLPNGEPIGWSDSELK